MKAAVGVFCEERDRAGGCTAGLLWGHRFASRTCGVGLNAGIKALSAVELGRTAATRCPTGTRSWWCLPPQQISALRGLLTAVLLVIKRSCIYFTPRAKGLGSEAELDLA